MTQAPRAHGIAERSMGVDASTVMVLRASHGRFPHRPPRVLRASCPPKQTKPHQCTQGRRGRNAAPVSSFPHGIRGRVRTFASLQHHPRVHLPIPVHDARRVWPQHPAAGAGPGGHLFFAPTAASPACSR